MNEDPSLNRIPPPKRGESLLMRIAVAVDCHERIAWVNFAAADGLEARIESTIRGASLALDQAIDMTETRELFGAPAGTDADPPQKFEAWGFVQEMSMATHAFVFDVSTPLLAPDEYLLDFDVVVGDRDDSFHDLKAASAMLARFVQALPDND